jgi:hypothetical protein
MRKHPSPGEAGRPFNDGLVHAAADYILLLDRGYPEKPSVALVGDRWRLSREERMMLYRGVCGRNMALERRSKLWIPGPAERPRLAVDAYNVLFTIINYRRGRALFLSFDGFLRDAGGIHGRLGDESLLEPLASDFLRFLASSGFSFVDMFLDRPVSRSGEHRALLLRLLAESGLSGAVELYDSADWGVKRSGAPLVATSDTGIIDAVKSPETQVFDAARVYLDDRYEPKYFDFSKSVGT